MREGSGAVWGAEETTRELRQVIQGFNVGSHSTVYMEIVNYGRCRILFCYSYSPT